MSLSKEISFQNISRIVICWRCSWIILFTCVFIIVTFLGAYLYKALPDNIDDKIIMGYRLTEMQFAIDSWNADYPLLTGNDTALYMDKYFSNDQARKTGIRAIGIGDDLGIYIAVPVIAALSGLDDPGLIIKYIVFLCFFILLCVYPIILFRFSLSSSLILLFPIMVVPGMGFAYISGFSATYWIQAWTALICIPFLWVVLIMPWSKRILWLLLVVAFIAAITSIFRSSAGLGLLLSSLMVVFFKLGYKKKAIIHMFIVLLVYLSFNQGLTSLATSHRNTSLSQAGVTDLRPVSHPLWHTVYIGLGWQDREMKMLEKLDPSIQDFFARLGFGVPNPWGIKYLDTYALKKAAEFDPDVIYMSKEYNAILQKEYFRLLVQNPLYFLENYTLKLLTSIGLSIWYFISSLVLFLSTGMFFIGIIVFKGAKSLWQTLIQRIKKSSEQFLIMVPVAVIGILQGVLASPNPKYLLGLTSSFYLTWMFLIIIMYQISHERLLAVKNIDRKI